MLNLKQHPRQQQQIESVVVCQVCGSRSTSDVVTIDDIPVHVGMFCDSREEALKAPKGDVRLTHCHDCHFTFNREFDSKKLFYSPDYEAALHYSQVFRDYIDQKTTRLVSDFNLHHKRLLEIASGDGWVLKRLCDLGLNNGIGIDPSSLQEGTFGYSFGELTFLREYYGEQHAGLDVDFVCCLSAFEHIPDPVSFLKLLRRNLGSRQADVYFEVFNAQRAFESLETWSPHYEQCNYFSQRSLQCAFERAGFRVIRTGSDYQGDQYLFIEATTDEQIPQCSIADSSEMRNSADVMHRFRNTHIETIAEWTARFAEWREAGKSGVFWGAAGKGITFLNSLPLADTMTHVVDINPQKHGKYVPGTGHLIIPPESLSEIQPDFVVISNALYKQEISELVSEMGLSCSIHVA